MKSSISYLVKFTLICILASSNLCNAGLFDDDLARAQIKQMQTNIDELTSKQNKIVLDLSNQIQLLKEENSKLQGQLEAIQYKQTNLEKRQQDLYLDLESRLRQQEQKLGQISKNQELLLNSNSSTISSETNKEIESNNENKKPTNKSPDKDQQATTENPVEIYEAALSSFKAAKYKEAAKNFELFINKYESHSLAANATLWLGYSYAAQRDCVRAINTYQKLISKWPSSPKAPDAMYSIAECQNGVAAKKTFNKLINTYPNSSAAQKAQQNK